MCLTNDMLTDYLDGQIEIERAGDDYRHRGGIAQISIEGSGSPARLIVRLTWAAKGVNQPPKIMWFTDNRSTFEIELASCQPNQISDGRLRIYNQKEGQWVTFFPAKDHLNINPSVLITVRQTTLAWNLRIAISALLRNGEDVIGSMPYMVGQEGTQVLVKIYRQHQHELLELTRGLGATEAASRRFLEYLLEIDQSTFKRARIQIALNLPSKLP